MEKSNNVVPFTNIDEYLATLPEDKRHILEALRQTIKEAAPEAEEVISYMMPTFRYHGVLLHFAAFKNHYSLFPGGTFVGQFKEELKSYKTSKGTISFSFDNPLPTALVKKIVWWRMEQNEEKQRLKSVKKPKK